MKFYGMPETKILTNKYSEMTKAFVFKSTIIGQCVIPKTFICDFESVPLIKGTSPVSGIIHDYLCRKDSEPKVTKKVAADVYLEAMKARGNSWWRRYGKYWVVRYAPGYFHKKKVFWKLALERKKTG